MMQNPAYNSFQSRDHGGGLDGAIAQYGGARADWLDLSTGINPLMYPVIALVPDVWRALPDHGAEQALIEAARQFWRVPPEADIVAAAGASALIAQTPYLAETKGRVRIDFPTYNEHEAAFRAANWVISPVSATARVVARVVVNPNNPTGTFFSREAQGLSREARGTDARQPDLFVIDESFCDVAPEKSLMDQASRPGTIILKSFGKFWGLAGVRLGFAIGDPALIARLRTRLGPWPVSGPALAIGVAALSDPDWAAQTRARLSRDAARLDKLVLGKGIKLVGGTALFRLYEVDDATVWQTRLARAHVWSRVFPYSKTWLRLGLPAPDRWDQLRAAL